MSKKTVAFQGEAGAYSEAAAYAYFGKEITTLPCKSFETLFAAVSEGEATHGMAPIENSLAGSIHRNYDLLLRNELHIIGEYHHRVNHCLMALPKVKLEDLQRVYSHPQALAQCENSLLKLNLPPIVAADTAGSARALKENNDQHSAALASELAAQVYGLNILQRNMEDNPINYTRFLVLAPQNNLERQKGDYRTSIAFSLINKPGILFNALSIFALREIDLTKIESRPQAGQPWKYLFHIDFIGHVDDPSVGRALNHLDEIAPFIRVFGSYPREEREW
ncbi:MAG: prephenate dehydratase [Chloroflexi bacterium]|nr:prephenate dehydratase [Chloroflexota bacterium]